MGVGIAALEFRGGLLLVPLGRRPSEVAPRLRDIRRICWHFHGEHRGAKRNLKVRIADGDRDHALVLLRLEAPRVEYQPHLMRHAWRKDCAVVFKGGQGVVEKQKSTAHYMGRNVSFDLRVRPDILSPNSPQCAHFDLNRQRLVGIVRHVESDRFVLADHHVRVQIGHYRACRPGKRVGPVRPHRVGRLPDDRGAVVAAAEIGTHRRTNSATDLGVGQPLGVIHRLAAAVGENDARYGRELAQNSSRVCSLHGHHLIAGGLDKVEVEILLHGALDAL